MKHLKIILFTALVLSILATGLTVLRPTQAHASGCSAAIWTSSNPTTSGEWVDAIGSFNCGFGTNTVYIYTGSAVHGPIYINGSTGNIDLAITYPAVSKTSSIATKAVIYTGAGTSITSNIYYETVYPVGNCRSGC